MDCIVCNRPADILFTKLPDRLHPEVDGEYTVKRCPECALLFIDPQPSESELGKHYPPTYGVYQRVGREKTCKTFVMKSVARTYFGYGKPSIFSRVLLFPFYFKLVHLPKCVPGGRVLDVGCGTGGRMRLFKELGWQVEGLELDRDAATKAADITGSPVHAGSIESQSLASNHYDVVYLNHVFEHLRDPCKSLAKIRDALKPGGELIIAVPNSESIGSRLFRRHWASLDVPRHLFMYNGYNLTTLLTKHGFEVVQKAYSCTLGDTPSSVAYALGRSAKMLHWASSLFWAVSLVLDPFLQRFALGDYVTVRAIRRKEISR